MARKGRPPYSGGVASKKQGYTPRRIVEPGGSGSGWYPGAAWWSFTAPSYPSGPDPDGWGRFVTAYIYRVIRPGDHDHPRYLALPYGCHWSDDKRERIWNPDYGVFDTLEEAMDFCEDDMRETGVLPK